MNFKVLLTAVFKDSKGEVWEELGICSIASVLRKNGYEVMLKAGSEARIDYNQIIRFKPAIIGIPVYNHTKEAVYRFCTEVKKRLSGVKICLGGYMPSYWGVEMMKEAAFIDYVIRGEGEAVFLDLVYHLEKRENLENISGLTYRYGGDIVENQDRRDHLELDTLPFPARDLLAENKLNIASISTSRGCLAGCHFCSSPNFWGKWRGRSVQNILHEIEYLYNLGARRFNFIDGSFEDPDQNFERIRAIAQGIIDLNLDISYFADIRAEFYKKAPDELIDLLKKSGLRYVCVGIETANELDHNLFGKHSSLEDNIRILEFLQRHRIGYNIGFINFTPYSTFKGLHQNLDFLEKFELAGNIAYTSNRYMAFKGSCLYHKIEKDGLMRQERYDDVYGYDYLDKRIMWLADYFNDSLARLDKETSGAIGNIYYSRDYYLNLLTHYKNQFRNKGLNQALNIVISHEKEINVIFHELNHRNSRLFRELLYLAEKAWDSQVAGKIMDNYMGMEYIRDTAAVMNRKKHRFAFDILSLGPQYEDWLYK
jgi:anaerobic magnesium-protoporphyrin IX monomethyl ester cyclase